MAALEGCCHMLRGGAILCLLFLCQAKAVTPESGLKGRSMSILEFLRAITALPGLSGAEEAVASYVAEAFRPWADEVRVDSLYSVIARVKGTGPKVMFCAHLDEIGLMVTQIEKDGSLRLGNVGGVDPRILPGMRVFVHGRDKLFGVVGAKAPHLLTDEDREKNYRREDLHVDLGLPYDSIAERVRVGDPVTLEARFTGLLNERYATKTADDRACVAILLGAMQRLKRLHHSADLYFVATSREEIGSFGALTAAFGIEPDLGLALDVCHAETPDAPKARTHKLNALVASTGPFIHPVLRKKLMDIAREQNIEVQTSVVPGRTYTDTDHLGIAGPGVPAALLELPLKYMHTTVETFDLRTLKEGARLLANFAAAVEPSWMEELWT